MRQLMVHDLTGRQRLRGFFAEECGTSRIIDGRNSAVRKFLQTDIEWLAFVDSDMGFEPDTFDRLIDAADPDERPVVGALCFGQRKGPDGPAGSRKFMPVPTIYRWLDEGVTAGMAPMYGYPKDSLVRCDATGAACFVVHRSVLEQVHGRFPYPREWFDETLYKSQVFSEDLTFFLRLRELGVPLYVHTGVKTSHYKHTYLEESTVGDLTDVPTFVVIPVKNRLDLTRPLLRQLAAQGGYDGIFVFDNGSNRETRNWLETCDVPGLEVFDAAGANIHQMWNAGMAEALSRAWPCNVAILNNDLVLGDGFLSGLGRALRSDPLVAAVCPNYDGREADGLVYTDDTCGGRYDGSGGFAGFAFMLKGEAGYRFPEELNWWFGESDMLMAVQAAGSKAAIVPDVTVEHVDGGSQTGDWDDPEMRELLAADRAWFADRWQVNVEKVAV